MRLTAIHVHRSPAVLAVLFGASLMSACGQAARPAAAPPSPDVWAVVDGQNITRDDVEKAYKMAVDPATAPPSDEEVMTAKLNIVDELITQQVLIARAHAAGLDATDAEVDKAFSDRKNGMADAAFNLQLASRGFTADDIKRGIRRELTAQKLLDRDVTSKVVVSDQDVTDYYTQNRAQFNVAETPVPPGPIVVTSGRDPQLHNRLNDDAGTPEEAGRKVSMLVDKLKGGADFAALAADYSEDPQSLAQGGDLGYVPQSTLNRISPQLRAAVLKMSPGNVTTVTVGSNYTILALIAKEAPGQRDLTTQGVSDGIRDMLASRRQELLHTAYVAAARADATVTNYLARQVVDAQTKAPAAAPSAAPAKP